jgi:ribosomal protein L30/L7E
MNSKAKYGKRSTENSLEQNNKQVQGMVCVISPWVKVTELGKC